MRGQIGLFEPKHTYSVFDNEDKLLGALLDIHCEGKDIDLDPMYNKGHFYRGWVNKPPLRFDLNAEQKGYDAKNGDATHLPIKDGSIGVMILDPPFMFGRHGKTDENRVQKRYTMFDTWKDLERCYKGALKEASRVLRKRGVLIFKCQDYTDSKTTMTHCLVYEWAVSEGFYAKDIAILNLNQPKIYNGNLKQKHLRKTHCYFWVFIKR